MGNADDDQIDWQVRQRVTDPLPRSFLTMTILKNVCREEIGMETGTEVRPSACCLGKVQAARNSACITAALDGCNESIDLPAIGSAP